MRPSGSVSWREHLGHARAVRRRGRAPAGRALLPTGPAARGAGSARTVGPSTTLIASNTPSPTVNPWSLTAIAGDCGSVEQLTVDPSVHAVDINRVPRGVPGTRRARVGPSLWQVGTSAMVSFAPRGDRRSQADVAQLVERNLAKVEVASSSLVVRSERAGSQPPRWGGREARQRTANPSTRVQIPYPPRTTYSFTRAIGAVVARFLDTEEVTGSNPVSPTSTNRPLTCGDVDPGAFAWYLRVPDSCQFQSGRGPRERVLQHPRTRQPRRSQISSSAAVPCVCVAELLL